MRIQSLSVKNVGMIADTHIDINKPLLVFYGEVRQGKTTLLNAVRWVCGGSWPSDIIRHGEKEAIIGLGFDGGCVTRSWYRNKDGETKARAVQFVRAGKPVANPVAELKRLMNPFLLDQDYLRNKTELERKQYFTELFAVDTSALDTELFNLGRQASDLRAKLTGYGDIDLKPVETIDTAALRQSLVQARQAHQAKVSEAQKHKAEKTMEWRRKVSATQQQNSEIERLRMQRTTSEAHVSARREQIKELEREIARIKEDIARTEQWLIENPAKDLITLPDEPSTAELDAIITSSPNTADIESSLQIAAAQNVRAEQYQKALERDAKRKADEAALKQLEDRQRQLRKDKIAALAKVNESCGVPGLKFEEDGTFSFEGTQAGMLSTSQIMRLSSALSALYPEGLSIELLDRGESLGRSIFDYVKHAEAKKISVLATVVGQRPAEVPENVGVFVVRDGVVMQDEVAK